MREASERDAFIAELYQLGRKAWPDIELARSVFVDFAESRVRAGDELCARDVFLASACAAGDPRALATFDRELLSAVPGFLARSKPSPSFVDEVRQLVRERLFVEGKINAYSGRGPLLNWLRVLTVRVASNHRRTERDHEPIEDDVLSAAALDPDVELIRRRYGRAFEDALRDAFAALTLEERSVLRLHYLEGLNLDKIALVLRVSRATAGRRVVAARERIAVEAHRAIRARLGASPEELDSLLRVVRSAIGLRLSMLSVKREG